jgi:hypothetical protein
MSTGFSFGGTLRVFFKPASATFFGGMVASGGSGGRRRGAANAGALGEKWWAAGKTGGNEINMEGNE